MWCILCKNISKDQENKVLSMLLLLLGESLSRKSEDESDKGGAVSFVGLVSFDSCSTAQLSIQTST